MDKDVHSASEELKGMCLMLFKKAIVADEVRKLAEESAKATTSIAQLTLFIQKNIEQVKYAIEMEH